MSGSAGYSYTISVCATQSGTYLELSSQNGTFNRTSDVLDDTDTTNAGSHTRLLGLLDAACNVDVHWAASNAALSAIETAFEGRSALWVKVLPDGQTSNGKKFPVVVENINLNLDVTALNTYSISFQGNGAVIADDA